MARSKRHSRPDDQAILEAFEPRAPRMERTATALGRTPSAIERRYYRLLAPHRGERSVTGTHDIDDPTS